MGLAEQVLGKAGLRECRKQRVTVKVESDEFIFDARQPTLAERDEIYRSKTRIETDERGKPTVTTEPKQLADIYVDAVLLCALDPATGDRVFKREHRDVLRGTPTGGWVEELGRVIISLASPEPNLGKGSVATPSDSSSTS